MQYTAENDIFQMKILDFVLIFAQNIDVVYTLEPPVCFGAKNKIMYTPVNPNFTI